MDPDLSLNQKIGTHCKWLIDKVYLSIIFTSEMVIDLLIFFNLRGMNVDTNIKENICKYNPAVLRINKTK